MIKLFAATIARATVFRALHYVRITDVAVEIHDIPGVFPDGSEDLSSIVELALPTYEYVRGIGPCADICVVHC